MDNLRNVFNKYASDPTFLASPKPIKSELRATLAEQTRKSGVRYAIVFVVAFILILILVAILLHDVLSGTQQYTGLAVAGLGIPVVLTALWNVGREWTQSNLMLTLIANSDETTARSIVRVMVQDYYAPRPDSKSK
jgi:hypothetical protein